MKDSDLDDLFTPVLTAHGLELEHLSVQAAGRRRVVKVVVDGDGPQGRGPLLDDIAAAAKQLNDLVDEHDPSGVSPYTIEVSSRGLSRPLTKPQHWRRNRGRLVRLEVGEEQLTGRVVASDDTTVTLQVGGGRRTLELAEVRRALVQVEFNRPAEPLADEPLADEDDEEGLDDELDEDASGEDEDEGGR
ncbi:ribosome maturation factor RimP [Desertihabitans brevis]|uniref:Ribosome maturation factor RimP n=1 Tax=Desertihabitans brevis TaxID=2268447 RepID=A0A367YXN8_9ACTN|nr:ribosome maturation factor RimP [Desertihabitans brevis]RCK70497.1 ribosome maturation factor RimP [Desertihabitans brevis]